MDVMHICLNVSDVEESVHFYVEELAFEETWEFTTADGETVNRYVGADNGVEIQLSESEDEVPGEAGDLWDHIAVSVEDVDAAFERIDHYGVVAEPVDRPEAGARTAFVEDPDGHVVELIEPLKG